MRKILWISLNAPYDKVDHAGGQVHNYYLKKLHASGKVEIKLISFCHPSEVEKLDLDRYGIDTTVFPQETRGLRHIFWGVLNLETRFNPWNRYCGITYNFFHVKLHKKIAELKKNNYKPDVIILQWTQMVFFIHYLKKVFPDSKFICIEEDVTYLGTKRLFAAKHSLRNYMRDKKTKKTELKALVESDLIICSNKKDVALLKQDNISVPIWSWCPFYNCMNQIERSKTPKNDILFFGAMNREANWKSVIWFIENAFSIITDKDLRLIILGSKPAQELQKYASERIIVTGYVDDIEPYFEKCMCLVVPLQMGAGIKIKVLEGMSSGIPVLSNNIGVEGIPAIDGEQYLHCETPEEFIYAIKKIISNEINSKLLGENGKSFVANNFDYLKDIEQFITFVTEI